MGSRRRDAIALIGALFLVAVAVWIVREIRTSNNPAYTATVYAAYLAVATLLVSLLAFLIPWWWNGRRATTVAASPVQITAAAEQLARSMLDVWRREVTERRISTPAPVRVRWRWGQRDVTPPLPELLTVPDSGIGPLPLREPHFDGFNPDEPGERLEGGVVTQLYEVYSKLPHGRLVLLGEPGTGKTGAMILLLLAVLDHRHSVPEAQRGKIPVPVWLALGGWDPTTQTLHQWAAATVYRDHPYLRAPDYGPDAAGALLSAGRVALFLDGLDEMVPSAQLKALARIEQEGAGLRFVLSSRPDDYRQAITKDRVHNTAVIEIQPVDPNEARVYLLRDQIGAQHDRWAQLGDYLTHHPGSIAAKALNNPLMLSLARATYQNQDPTPLTNPAKFPTEDAVRAHLIERTLIIAYPDERQRAHAIRWLAWIAHHLDSDRDRRNLSWWHIPTWIPRWQRRLVGGIVGGLGVGLVDGLAGGLGVGLMGGLWGGFVGVCLAVYVSEVQEDPRMVFLRWPRAHELSRVLAVGLGGSLGNGLLGGFFGGGMAGLVGALGGGLGNGFLRLVGLWTVPLPRATTATPTSSYRLDRRTSLVIGLGVGLIGGLGGGFVIGLGIGPAVGFGGGLGSGLANVLVGGFVIGLVIGLIFTLRGGSMKVSLTELILTTTGTGRVKFIQVLEDAHRRQILRQAGAVYQFRHAELQDHLAEIHRKHTQPSMSTRAPN